MSRVSRRKLCRDRSGWVEWLLLAWFLLCLGIGLTFWGLVFFLLWKCL